VLRGDGQVASVYGAGGAPEPAAQRLCGLLDDTLEKHRAACCNQPPHVVITSECVRMLSAAIKSKAVTLDAAALDGCEKAFTAAMTGCDWVGPFGPDFPPACTALLQGHLAAGATCHSSVECVAGLHCSGVGPTAAGTCAAPASDGAPCNLAVDPLQLYTRQDAEAQHGECAGRCDRHHCAKPVPEAGECHASVECGREAHCGAGHCRRGRFAPAGEACTGADCAAGLHCIDGKCATPRPTGAACQRDHECRGGCVRADGGTSGACGPRCDRR
jgi:hypothetical protein